MFQEDYIMRLVRQLSQALTRILFLKDNKQYQDALEEIQHTGKLFFGLDLSAIHTVMGHWFFGSALRCVDGAFASLTSHPCEGRDPSDFQGMLTSPETGMGSRLPPAFAGEPGNDFHKKLINTFKNTTGFFRHGWSPT